KLVGRDGLSPEANKALEATMHLAALVDQRILPMTNLSRLIRVLYSVPRSNTPLKPIFGPGKYAYDFAHHVIMRLIKALSRTGEGSRTGSDDVLLDDHSCNSLLHYALLHRRSPNLAAIVLRYMFGMR